MQTSVRVGSSAAQVIKILENEMHGNLFVVSNRCLSSHGGFTEHVPVRIWQISWVSSTVDNPLFYRSVYPGKGVFG